MSHGQIPGQKLVQVQVGWRSRHTFSDKEADDPDGSPFNARALSGGRRRTMLTRFWPAIALWSVIAPCALQAQVVEEDDTEISRRCREFMSRRSLQTVQRRHSGSSP